MTQKICPRCRHSNALENDFCGRCGARLETAIARQSNSELTIGAGSLLPVPVVKQAVRAAAVSLLALAAEAGVAWLRRRSEAEPTPTVIRPAPVKKEEKKLPASSAAVTIFSRRVVQVWQRGRLRGQGVEESVWQWHEEI